LGSPQLSPFWDCRLKGRPGVADGSVRELEQAADERWAGFVGQRHHALGWQVT